MQNTIKIVLCAFLVMTILVSILTSCGTGQSQNDDKGKSSDVTVHNHIFSEWTITKDSTCTIAGTKERVCDCGEKETSAIEVSAHNYGDWEVIKEASCTETGVQLRECSSCDYIERSNIKAKGHTTQNGECQRCFEYFGETQNDTNNNLAPTEEEYTSFICDYYNKQINTTLHYFTYSLDKHAYQIHLGPNFIDGYKILSGDDVFAAYEMHKVFNELFNTYVNMNIQWLNEQEYTYGYKLTMEVLSPGDEEILFIVQDGKAEYCAYFNFVRME